MTINRSNFEAYLLDYLEGILDPLLTADLMAFLAENPEFEKYLPDYDGSLSLSDDLLYSRKDRLKKELSDLPEITPGNFDEFCIASCEGMLNVRDSDRLLAYISLHPEKQHDYELYQKLKLFPDHALQYGDKNRLKKRTGNVSLRYLYIAASIAASLILLFLLVFRKPAGPVLTETLPVRPAVQENPVQTPGATPAAPHVRSESAIKAEAEKKQQKYRILPETIHPPAVESNVYGRTEPALAIIKPVAGLQVAAAHQPPPLTAYLTAEKGILQNRKQEQVLTSDSFADSGLGRLLSRIDFWRTAESAIAGFNYLTESQLSVDRITDESGNITNLQIRNESYVISRKIKQPL
jgi:hypothetical protein